MDERINSGKTSSVSPEGEVTIPAEIGAILGVAPRDSVTFEVKADEIDIRPVSDGLAVLYRSVPALGWPLSDTEMTHIAHEEQARHVAEEGRPGKVF